jgi:hypothetical protein
MLAGRGAVALPGARVSYTRPLGQRRQELESYGERWYVRCVSSISTPTRPKGLSRAQPRALVRGALPIHGWCPVAQCHIEEVRATARSTRFSAPPHNLHFSCVCCDKPNL